MQSDVLLCFPFISQNWSQLLLQGSVKHDPSCTQDGEKWVLVNTEDVFTPKKATLLHRKVNDSLCMYYQKNITTTIKKIFAFCTKTVA